MALSKAQKELEKAVAGKSWADVSSKWTKGLEKDPTWKKILSKAFANKDGELYFYYGDGRSPGMVSPIKTIKQLYGGFKGRMKDEYVKGLLSEHSGAEAFKESGAHYYGAGMSGHNRNPEIEGSFHDPRDFFDAGGKALQKDKKHEGPNITMEGRSQNFNKMKGGLPENWREGATNIGGYRWVKDGVYITKGKDGKYQAQDPQGKVSKDLDLKGETWKKDAGFKYSSMNPNRESSRARFRGLTGFDKHTTPEWQKKAKIDAFKKMESRKANTTDGQKMFDVQGRGTLYKQKNGEYAFVSKDAKTGKTKRDYVNPAMFDVYEKQNKRKEKKASEKLEADKTRMQQRLDFI